jgi:tRNA pseudouridine55 synthase
MDGVLLINKPIRMTSHTIVNRLRGRFKIPTIGHAGTLDPLATGVLVVLIGRAVKLNEFIVGHDKTYRVTGLFGQMRDSFDIFGKIVEENQMLVSQNELETVIRDFPRQYDQTPPVFSAIKVKGKTAYRRTRSGETLTLADRNVFLHNLELEDFSFPRFTIHVSVSSGTYIRSLIVDIAKKLNTIACVESLQRIESGHFHLNDCHTFAEVYESKPEEFPKFLLPSEDAIPDYPYLDLSDEDGKKYLDGTWLRISELFPENPPDENVVYRVRRAGRFVALGYSENGILKVKKTIFRE